MILEQLQVYIDVVFEKGYVVFDMEIIFLDVMQVDLVGILLSLELGQVCYILLIYRDGEGDFLGGGGLLLDQILLGEVFVVLKLMLED